MLSQISARALARVQPRMLLCAPTPRLAQLRTVASASAAMKLYVGNLSWESTSEFLLFKLAPT
jgi:hypothetical protein